VPRLYTDLDAVHRLIRSYRKSRPTSKYLPRALWERIVPLLHSHSPQEVASRLGVALPNLTRRARLAKAHGPVAQTTFVEVPLPRASVCLWELELPGGIKLRGFS